MRVYRVDSMTRDTPVAEVVAADEQEARGVWRSYLNGFRVTDPGAGVPAPFVVWADPDWDRQLASASENSPAMQSWRGSEFTELREWLP
jgi:hypothetical protein